MPTRRDLRRRTLREDTRGLSTAEYIILMALICVVGFICWRLFGDATRGKAAGGDQVVDSLATHSTADDGTHHGAEAAPPPTTAAAPGGPVHGGRGDIPQARRMSIPGQDEGTYGEDEEVTRSRTRSRNFRWIAIGVLTAGIMAILLGKKRSGN
jgi:hypothetical protein